jgi:hypothetical protein
MKVAVASFGNINTFIVGVAVKAAFLGVIEDFVGDELGSWVTICWMSMSITITTTNETIPNSFQGIFRHGIDRNARSIFCRTSLILLGMDGFAGRVGLLGKGPCCTLAKYPCRAPSTADSNSVAAE